MMVAPNLQAIGQVSGINQIGAPMFGAGGGAKTAQGFDPMGGFGPYQVVGFGNKKAGGGGPGLMGNAENNQR